MSAAYPAIEVARAIAATVLVFLALCVLLAGFRVLLGGKNEYERNRSRARSFRDVFLGRIPTRRDGIRDDKVPAGLAIDAQKNEWIEQGRFSEEALHDVIMQ